MQVDSEKETKQKTEKKNIIVFNLLCLYLLFYSVLNVVLYGEYSEKFSPLNPPAVSHFIMSKKASQGRVHHERWLLFRSNFSCLIRTHSLSEYCLEVFCPLFGDVLPLLPIFNSL